MRTSIAVPPQAALFVKNTPDSTRSFLFRKSKPPYPLAEVYEGIEF